ncbi:MAG TPA: trypsin-like peptidase domain-containing protein, partial [Jatrophihabitantaceae bacterium]|nr:trypsin-like peptidase domain-containing protein [Jatrophihabitantaceae bacterium]
SGGLGGPGCLDCMQPYQPEPSYPAFSTDPVYPAYSGYGGHPPLPPEAPIPPGPPPPPAKRRAIRYAIVGATVLAAACATAGVGYAIGATHRVSGSGTALPSQNGNGGNGLPGGYGNYPFPGSNNSNNTTSAGTATAAQSVGVVDINTVLGYQNAAAAGTGLIASSNGEVVTNNHVVNGATSVRVTVVSTGQTYTATVVGTDPTDDIAVLQLQNASGLTVANFGDSSTAKVGDKVVGVGNAGGTGGTPSAASGSVTALNQTITASDEGGSNSETINGLIETNAQIAAGDSGGPLYNSAGKVIGIDTAADTGRSGSTIAAYAIPIDKALTIAAEIESGQASSTIHIGSTGFVGVSVAATQTTSGVLVEGVVPNGPAAQAGVVPGDSITAVDGTKVNTSSELHNALASKKPGQQVRLTWTDQSGASHAVTVTLVAGPAD